MAAHGARRLLAMADNASAVIGIELLAAAQGCDFHAGLSSSDALEAVRTRLRAQVPMLDHDRHFHPDMEAATALVRGGVVPDTAGLVPPGIAYWTGPAPIAGMRRCSSQFRPAAPGLADLVMLSFRLGGQHGGATWRERVWV